MRRLITAGRRETTPGFGQEMCCQQDDEMMESVLRSAWLDTQGFREMIAETARQFNYLDPPDGKIHE